FRSTLASGVPLLITGVHRRLQGQWTPEEFTDSMNEEVVTCIDCNSDDEADTKMPAGAFFPLLSRAPGEHDVVHKIKDWPPDKHFREVFRRHYLAYNQCFPEACADFLRSDGAANLAACWPETPGAPDLGQPHSGPKMYTAMGNRADWQGTTRLHLDVTDAANIMAWAASGDAPAAIWHIFPRTDAAKLVEAIRTMNWCKPDEHPIHSQ
ncbi:hypothetical protein C8Q76DRAFT_591854, partial [Earliella scabrosa]